CEHFGQSEMTKSKDPKKETTTKRIGCTWQINLSCPEKENPNKIVYIAKLVNEYKNHDFNQARYNFQENIAFTKEITNDIEFFVTKMNCSPNKFDQTNDASKLYQELLNKKEADSR
ncbi:8417_t:CDS:2, partial [Racocetra persica]